MSVLQPNISPRIKGPFPTLKILIIIFVVALLFLISGFDYPLIHSIIEMAGIIIVAQIALLGAKSEIYSGYSLLLFLGIGFLFVAVYNSFHLLTYEGMGLFPQFAGANKSAQFWLLSRLTEAVTLLAAPSFINRQLKSSRMMFTVYGGITILMLYCTLIADIFPACFIDGQGITPFKIGAKFLVFLILAAAYLRFHFSKEIMDSRLKYLLQSSILLSIFSELIFILFWNVYGAVNFVGHILKLMAYLFVYEGSVTWGLSYPFETIFFRLHSSLKEIEDKNRELAKEVRSRKAKERLLKLAYQEIDQIVETAADGMCVIDSDYKLVRINKAWCDVLGQTKDELIGRNCYDIFHGPECYTAGCGMKRILAGHPRWEYTIEHQGQPEIPVYGLVTVSPFYDDAGEIRGVVESFKDLREYRQLAQEISRAEKLDLMGDIAVGLGHEIRNPLTTIRGFLQFYLEKHGNTVDTEIFDIMISELDRANMVISEFILLSQDKAVDKKSYYLNQLIYELAIPLSAEARRMEHKVSLDLKSVPKVTLDTGEIRQLIMHLVRNGMEAMTEPGTITIRTSFKNDRVVLSISDQGMGIPADLLKKIGTPFKSTKDFSLGLGLPICYAIAKRHQADISIDTGPSGTTVSVSFPTADTEC